MLGLYDSGIGGLTILNQIQKQLPSIEISYLADTKHCPLGEKTAQEILEITTQGVKFLFEKGCNLVILACNTATVIAIKELQNNWLPKYYPDKKILGIVRPIPELLIERNFKHHQNVMLLATLATVRSEFYTKELADFNFNNVSEIACPGLASAIESQNPNLIKQAVSDIFENNPINFQDFDVILLACTHYPLATETIKEVFIENGGKTEIQIFDQTKLIAQKLIEYLKNHPEIDLQKGGTTIYHSGNEQNFDRKVSSVFPELKVQRMILGVRT